MPEIKFGANIEALKSGLDGIGSSVDGLRGQLDSLAEAFGVALSIEGIKQFVESMADLGEKSTRTAAILGASNEQVVALSGYASLGGESMDELAGQIQRAQLTLQKSTKDGINPAAQALNVLHLSASELIGLSPDQFFLKLSDAVSKFNPSLNLTTAITQAFGRGVAQMLPSLLAGKEHIEEFQQAWAKASDGLAAAIPGMADTKEKISLLDQSAESLGARIFSALKPAIDGVITSFTNWAQAVKSDDIRGAVDTVGNTSITVAQDIALFFINAKEAWDLFVSSIQKDMPLIHAAAGAALAVLGQGGAAIEQFKEALAGVGQGQSFEAIEAGANKSREAINQMADDMRKALAAGSPKAGSGAAMAADFAAIQEGVQGVIAAYQKLNAVPINEGAGAGVKAAQAKINGEIEVLQEGLKQKTTLYDSEVSQYQITQNQKYGLLQTATQQEYDAEMALLQKEAALGNQSVATRQEIQNKIKALRAKHDEDMLKLDEDSIKAAQTQWTSFLTNITSSFNSNIRGLLSGTETWSQAFKKTLGDLIIKFIEFGEQVLVKWIATELAKTTATTTGAAARTAAEETSATATIGGRIAAAISAIMMDAAQTFGGVFAFLAPEMGPAAAGPAAASAASVSAAAIFAVGTDYVERGGLALIHPGETIIPAARGSGPYTGQGGRGGGSSGSTTNNFNISANDSRDVARFFNDNAGHMLKAINSAVRKGTHLNLRSARA